MNKPLRITHPILLHDLAGALERQLTEAAGQPMGFILVMMPLDEQVSFGDFISNIRGEDLQRVLRQAANSMGGVAQGDQSNVHRA